VKKANIANDLSSSVINPGEGKNELEKRRSVIGKGEGEGLNDEGGSLSLNLGGHGYPFTGQEEEKSEKKTKVIGTTSAANTTSLIPNFSISLLPNFFPQFHNNTVGKIFYFDFFFHHKN